MDENISALKVSYETQLSATKRQVWVGFALVLSGMGLGFMGYAPGAVTAAIIFVLFCLYGVYKTIKFQKLFRTYWQSQGLDDAAIKAKWQEVFLPSFDG